MSEELSRDATNHMDVICEAKIKPKARVFQIVSAIITILFIALLIISRIPYRYYDSGVHYNSRISYLLPQYEYTVSAYNCFGETIYKLKSGAYDESNATLGEMKDASEMLSTHIYGFELLYNNDITIAIICVLILSVVWNCLCQ